jgi:pimeloyl-ACP methyl ester carboxylesterase
MAYGPPAGAPDSSIALVEGPWTHRVVPANGITVHIAELGTGPLVLLLHGFPQFWWAWRRQLVDIADAGFRCVAVDMRGYGASDKPPRGYDTPTLARDMAQLVSALGETDAMIAGTDVGGLLAWTMASRHPRVVRSLAIVGAAHPLRLRHVLARSRAQRVASRYALRTFQLPRRPEHLLGRDGDYVRSLFDRWSGPRWRATAGYEAEVTRYAAAMRIHPVGYCAAEYFRWLVRSQLRPDGRRYAAALASPIATPVLQLHGDLDSCVLPSTAQGSGQFVSGEYEWRLLDGVGHFPHNEVPELVSGELVRWAKLH